MNIEKHTFGTGGFKIAAKLGRRYTAALETNESIIALHVTANLLERHIKPIFG